jgi:non-ribosomal peptide synthetase component E (peptide arylation enzyme)
MVIEVGGLHRLLVETAERFPTRPALMERGASTAYAELNKASGKIAWSLASLGLRRGDRVVLAKSGEASSSTWS